MTDISPFGNSNDLARHAQEIGQDAVRYLWQHDTQVAEYADVGPLLLVEGDGSILRDIHGKEYIDCGSRLCTAAIGHGRKEMAEAVASQMSRLQYANNSVGIANLPATLLAKKLAQICPGELETTFFVNSGTEANETAFKMVRQAQLKRGFNRRWKIIAQHLSYHGTTWASLSACGESWLKAPNEPMVPGFVLAPQPYCYRCDLGLTYPACELLCAKMVENLIRMEGPETVAAFVAAPITVTFMVAVPPPQYWPTVREICDRHGVLLIADEVLVGFGRTGRLFCSEHWGLEPDVMTMAKGISSGYLPLSGAIATREIAQLFWGKKEDQFVSAGTYSGHPVACVAGLTNIAIMEREQLVQRSAEMGKRLVEGLQALEERPYVGNFQGLGLLATVELVSDRRTKARLNGKAMEYFMERTKELGLLLPSRENVVFFSPPLVIEPDQVDRIVTVFRQTLDEMQARFPSN